MKVNGAEWFIVFCVSLSAGRWYEDDDNDNDVEY